MSDLRDQSFGQAPGSPGIAPTWTSSAKDIVGCALGPSRVWFTLGFGIVNEVYYPRIDIPQIRDLGFIVADGRGFWAEVKRLENYSLRLLAPGTPAVEIIHTHERFRLTLRLTPDPDRDVLLMEIDLFGDAALRPYVLLAPRLGTEGRDNTAEIHHYGARRVLAAEQGPFGLALAAVDEAQADAFGAASAGYVGESDGWQDFHRNGALTWRYARAGPGNVALIAALPRRAVLGLGFGSSAQAAATLAVSGLMQPFARLLDRQIEDWRGWHARCGERALLQFKDATGFADQFVLSSMVLRTHRDKTYPGAMTASLSVPWGNSRDDRGGYHLVWPRDLVQCATALLGLGAEQEARDTLCYLIATQKQDGSWYQNQWLGVTVADALLRVDTPNGPTWHRYNGDGYGEHADGRPFDGSGRGRAWPLLTGERGHYELVAGNDPAPYLKAMAAMTGPGGMMPEQVWDSAALPERRLFPGRPTGGAMPLVWTHAEFIKLLISRHLGYPVDRPAAAWRRYGGRRPEAARAVWCFHAPIRRIRRGQSFIIASPRPALIHWGIDGWKNVADGNTEDSGLGQHSPEIGAAALSQASTINFTLQWRDDQHWVGTDYQVGIDG